MESWLRESVQRPSFRSQQTAVSVQKTFEWWSKRIASTAVLVKSCALVFMPYSWFNDIVTYRAERLACAESRRRLQKLGFMRRDKSTAPIFQNHYQLIFLVATASRLRTRSR
jgi:hypothetical protein